MSDKRYFGFAEFSTWVSEKVDGALASVAASLGSKVDKTDDFGQYKVGELELAVLLADLASGADLATLQQGFNDFVAAKASVAEAVAGTDDVKYITAVSAKAAIDSAVNELIGASPEALNTIAELAEALQNNPDVITELTTLVGQKLDATATAVNSQKLEGSSKAQVVTEAVAAAEAALADDLAGKLNATAKAADSAKLEGSTKAQVVAEAVAGSATAINSKLDATATAADSAKLGGSTKAQVVAEAVAGSADAIAAKLGKTEQAADSAKLGGSTKAQVVTEAQTGMATQASVATKLDATATAVNSSKLEGSTKAQVVAEARSGLGTASTANIFVSTVDPVASDGKDGDLWIKYTP